MLSAFKIEDIFKGQALITFTRDDGRKLEIIDGFRNRVLGYRVSQTPAESWTEEDYNRAAVKRLKRHKRLVNKLSALGATPAGAEILEIGCGDGINSLLFGFDRAKRAVGIDLDARLRQKNKRGEAARRLADGIIMANGYDGDYERYLAAYPVELMTMDATRMSFPDDSFDFAISRSVLEHILPIGKLYSEIKRVVRPGGIVYHEIDPFYWLRGCHKRGLVDIPWAHARLTPDEYHRFVSESEGSQKAAKRFGRIMTLSRLTCDQWKILHDSGTFEILSWDESESSFAGEILNEYPDIVSTLLSGVERQDLLISRIRIGLRNRK